MPGGTKRKAPAKPAKKAAKSKEVEEEASGPFSKMTAAEVWSSAEYVEDGSMSQHGFAALCAAVSIEEMSFEQLFLMFQLGGCATTVENAMTVCPSKQTLQRTFEHLGCRTLGELPARLKAKCGRLQDECARACRRASRSLGSSAPAPRPPPRLPSAALLLTHPARAAASSPRADDDSFQIFFRWLFEMGKALAALSNGRNSAVARTVPLAEGLSLMEAALRQWPLMPELKGFCEGTYGQPFSRDLWTQIARLAHMTQVGQIQADLSNYDDDVSGGGSAWPSAIDEFVEYVQEARAAAQ